VRGRRLIFVEVKRRTSWLEAEAALSPRQAGRIARAAEYWVHRNPRFRDHEISIDALLMVPGRLPRHLPGALNVTASRRR
jgi:putative endonuclease